MSKQLNYKIYSKSHFSEKMEKEAQFRNRGDAEGFFDRLHLLPLLQDKEFARKKYENLKKIP